MDWFEFDIMRSVVLRSGCDKSYDEILGVLNEIQTRFEFGSTDLQQILFCCPAVLEFGYSSLKNNLEQYERNFNIKSNFFRLFVMKFPFIMIIKQEVFYYKIKLLSSLFACSMIECLEKVFVYPDLLFITKSQIIEQTKMLVTELDEFGIGTRKIICECPALMFISKDHIRSLCKIMMYEFSLSMGESQRILKTIPYLLCLSEKQLKSRLDFYYPKYFVKRDLKEMLPKCPQLLIMNPCEFQEKFMSIQKILGLKFKQTAVFVRSCPNIMFFNNLECKFEGFKKFNINFEFLKIHPNICMSPEISIPIKFILARILGLESDFEEICAINTRTFVGRFLFMQDNEIFNHHDLLLSEEEFSKKYEISPQLLRVNYSITTENVNAVAEYYLNLKERLPSWTDIVFPEIQTIVDYLREKNTKKSIEFGYFQSRDRYNLTLKEYDLMETLITLHLEYDECLYIVKLCPFLAKSGSINLVKSIDVLRKYGLSLEDCVRIILQKPSVFTYFIGDFDELIKENMLHYECQFKEALNYMI